MPARKAITGQKIDKNVMNSRISFPDHFRKQELKADAPRLAAPKPTSSVTSSVLNNTSYAAQKKPRIFLTASNVTKYHDDSGTELDEASRSFLFTAAGAAKDDDASASTDDGDSDESDHSWLDGTTLIAGYAEELDTPEERAVALVEYLQVPFQEKSHELKRDLCNSLTTALNEIRSTHLKLDQGPDVDRAKAIIHFTDICEKRHVGISQLYRELSEGDTEKQLEINKLFVQLKQTYDARKQLWTDFEACIRDLTFKQTAILEQLDDNMAQTIEQLEKKYKNVFKESAAKDKGKLIRNVLERV